MLGLGDGLGRLLDSLLRLDHNNFVLVLSSSQVSLLALDSLSCFSGGVPVAVSSLPVRVLSVVVGVSAVSCSDSVDGSSFGLLGNLNRVRGLRLNSDVVSVVSGPRGIDGRNRRLDGRNLSGVSCDL